MLNEMSEAAMSKRIRRLAKKLELIAGCKTAVWRSAGCIERMWWFSDDRNRVKSSPHGLNDHEALAFLKDWEATD